MSLISPEQVLSGALDFLEVGDARLVSPIGGIFDQNLAVADDGVQRSAQFVAHIGQERRFGARSGFRLGAALLGLFARRADFAGIFAEHRQRAAHVAEFIRAGRWNRRRQVALSDRQHAAGQFGQA